MVEATVRDGRIRAGPPFEGLRTRGRARPGVRRIILPTPGTARSRSWPRSTKSSSSATSAATPKCATRPTAAPSATSAIATTRSWKNKESGDKSEETEWHRVVFYDKLAEIAGEYLKKGRSVYVEGRLKTRKWQDKDGVEKYTTEIVASDMQMLGSREGMGGGAAERRRRRRRLRALGAGGASGGGGGEPAGGQVVAGFSDMDDDIPF